jgi:protein gp37
MSNPIGWCEQTLNPLVGCTKCSPACDHCYAERMARRLQAMGTRGYDDVVDDAGRWTGRVAFVESELQKPLRRRKPTTYFMVSMGDVFHSAVTDDMRDKIFATMDRCREHTFIVLTKRIQSAKKYIDRVKKIRDECVLEWPLPNVELDVSIWDQSSADAAVPVLLDTPAAVRGVSIEPMLGLIDLGYTFSRAYVSAGGRPCLDRVILGGENGPGARPMHPDWVRSVRDQCVDAGVPFWFKSWGDAVIEASLFPMLAGWDPDAKHGGHILDGREWRQTPEQKR